MDFRIRVVGQLSYKTHEKGVVNLLQNTPEANLFMLVHTSQTKAGQVSPQLPLMPDCFFVCFAVFSGRKPSQSTSSRILIYRSQSRHRDTGEKVQPETHGGTNCSRSRGFTHDCNSWNFLKTHSTDERTEAVVE